MDNAKLSDPKLLKYLNHGSSIYTMYGFKVAKTYLTAELSLYRLMRSYVKRVTNDYNVGKFDELFEELQGNFLIGVHCQETNMIAGYISKVREDTPNILKYFLAAFKSTPMVSETDISRLHLYVAINYDLLRDSKNSSLHLMHALSTYQGKTNIAKAIRRINLGNKDKSEYYLKLALSKQIEFEFQKNESTVELAAILEKNTDFLTAKGLYLSMLNSIEYKALSAQKLLNINSNLSNQQKDHLEKFLIKNQNLFYSFTVEKQHKKSSTSASKKSLITADQILPPDGMRFIPSVLNAKSSPIRHFLHVHLSKSSGTGFTDPIWQSIKLWYLEQEFVSHWDLLNKNEIAFPSELNFFAEDGLNYSSGIQIEDLIQLVGNSKKFSTLDFSYLRTHLYNHHTIWNSLKDNLNIEMVRIGLYRDPIERLKSAINQLYHGSAKGSTNRVMRSVKNSIVTHTDNATAILNNPMYRGLMSNYIDSLSLGMQTACVPQIDYLIPSSNRTLISSLQSSIISQFKLPNILQSERIHSRPAHSKMKREMMDSLLDECFHYGLVEYDNIPYLKELSQKPIPDILLNSQSATNNYIHPLTIIYQSDFDASFKKSIRIVPTKSLL